MCNRIRGLKEWSEIPRTLGARLINNEYNPNVAPTEPVPAILAERRKPLETRLAHFGINLVASPGKRRPPLLNARTDTLRRGSFKTMLVDEAPKAVVDIAVKAAGLIGNGLYGVDLKQNDRGIFVIEINDNPNIDTGVEDLRLKDELYKIIVREFIRRLDGRTNGETGRG